MIQNVSSICKSFKKGEWDVFSAPLGLYIVQMPMEQIWNNEELLYKITIIQKRGRHGTQRNSGHSLGEKSWPGSRKMRAWQPGEQPIHREHGEGSRTGFSKKGPLEGMCGKQQFGAAGVYSTFSKISRERQVHNPRKAKG